MRKISKLEILGRVGFVRIISEKRMIAALFLILMLPILSISCSRGGVPDGAAPYRVMPASPRPAGQENALLLTADPIPVVRIGFIGVGNRGFSALYRYTFIEGVEITAICDLEGERVEKSQELLTGRGHPIAAGYVGEEEWRKVCERDDIDLIYISTDWLSHVPIALYAMEQGKHVAVEVPAATTVEDCWQLVDSSERTRRHCMMLENCCYDFFELNTLNMAQQGVFGEVIHVEGAYIHELRQFFDDQDDWRIKFYRDYTGNPYPTHGLGPLCQILNIHRGDRLKSLVSISTDQYGISNYLKNRFGEESSEAAVDYKLGDMNSTIIKTEKGKTILLQYDVISPRPYSRLHTISGTKGFAQKYPNPVIALDPDSHQYMDEQSFNDLMSEYEHRFIKEIGDEAKRVGGHGGMDFMMDYRLIYCLRNGLPLDQDVYDAAEWSSIVELSNISALNGGIPVEIPDFTRGDWNVLEGLQFAK